MPIPTLRLFTAVALLALALLTSACGSDEEDSVATGPSDETAEAAFLKAMIPHHEAAIEMANLAEERGDHAEVRKLARSIIRSQGAEVDQMEEIYASIFGETIIPQPEAYEQLGLTPEEAGAHSDTLALEEAREFDREFIDMMIPHHQGAIRMAHAVIPKAKDDQVRRLAEEIIGAQSREIEQMNAWRKDWYGKESPSGGVPTPGSEPEHGGGHTEED